MSVVYNTPLKNTRLTDVVNAIDTGGAGYIEIGTAGMASVLVTLPFHNPCGSVSGGVLSFLGTPFTADAANSGVAAAAAVYDGAGLLIISGLTVGTSGSDINLSSTSIVASQPVTLTAATITHG